MAKKTLIIDDLTGDTGAKTRTFRVDGVDYEIDLTDASYAELKAALKPYLRAARQVGGPVVAGSRRARSSTPSRSRSKGPTEAAIIRAWARSVGMPVTERGRVAPDVRKAWEAAGSPR
ncbi:MAG: Lsr2 family protein [Actinomycetales bacterium]|nr:Lsr2 family protein [Actinomycetales bacterium]